MEIETDVVKRGSITEIVKAYEEAIQKIDTAYGILLDAEKQLKSAFSVKERYDTDFGTLPGHHYDSTDNVENSIEGVKTVIKRKAWRCLYYSLEIDRIVSIKRRDEIYETIDRGDLPEITVKSVFEMFETLNQNINEFAKESVKEVYDWLRPPADYDEMRSYKTNQKNARYELGSKVIKTRMVDLSFGSFQVNHYHEKYLIALDKVFHMLDGKNMLDKSYRGVLVDAINHNETGVCDTDYFHCRMYRNGNLHIEMLRPDLVQQFNAIAGGMNLKPSNTK